MMLHGDKRDLCGKEEQIDELIKMPDDEFWRGLFYGLALGFVLFCFHLMAR